MSEENEVLYDVKDRIATVTLNRPERMNSIDELDADQHRQGDEAGGHRSRRARDHPDGCRGRAFCGADIGRLQRRSGGERPPPPADDPTVIPAITLGHGPDLGPGRRPPLFLLHAHRQAGDRCAEWRDGGPRHDHGALLRYADGVTNDEIFTTAFAQRGLIAQHGIAWLLPRLIGPSNAIDLLMSAARRVTAKEALDMGLVNRIYPQDTFVEDVRTFCSRADGHGVSALDGGDQGQS